MNSILNFFKPTKIKLYVFLFLLLLLFIDILIAGIQVSYKVDLSGIFDPLTIILAFPMLFLGFIFDDTEKTISSLFMTPLYYTSLVLLYYFFICFFAFIVQLVIDQLKNIQK